MMANCGNDIVSEDKFSDSIRGLNIGSCSVPSLL